MKYEAPELTALTPATIAIHGFSGNGIKGGPAIIRENKAGLNEHLNTYVDWED